MNLTPLTIVYRPISLLLVFNLIFEKTMYHRLKSFLEKNDILHDSQYGFREKRWTEHAILDITHQMESNMDKVIHVWYIYWLTKGFWYSRSFNIIFEKLNHYGMLGIINDWFASYLVGRKQITQTNQKNMSSKETATGLRFRSPALPYIHKWYRK